MPSIQVSTLKYAGARLGMGSDSEVSLTWDHYPAGRHTNATQMAPTKKKKKPVSNPARGFATTSTASKSKYDEAKELEGGVRLEVSNVHAVSTEDGSRKEDSSNREPEKALDELTSEELESQLEGYSLQILVENHGEKTKRSVSRQASRLLTEKRLLRSQAEYLGIRQWLPPEIIQLITDLLHGHEDSKIYSQATFDTNKLFPELAEDDLLIKLWTLKKLLPQLGFSGQRTELALRHLLIAIKESGPQSLFSGKESAWGLDECLTWLALDSEPADLPRFDPSERQSHCSVDQRRPGLTGNTPTNTENTPATTPPDSRPESPLSKEDPPQQPQIPDEDSSLSSAGDSDNDADPEQLVIKYLDLQSRLNKINPELTEIDARWQRRSKGKRLVITGNLDSASKRRTERLTAKIHRIKSDLLFDEDKANSRWAEIRINLAQEAAERKKLGITNDGEQEKVTPTVRSNSNVVESNHGDDDTDGMLAGFFTSLPDTATDPATGLSIMSTTSEEGSNVEIRDFGKWTGMSPRRVLEEACKAR